MMQKKIKEKAEQKIINVIGRYIRTEMEAETKTELPGCMLFTHQPKRPRR